VKTIADARGTARSNLVAQAATGATPWAPPAARARVADRDQAGDRRSADLRPWPGARADPTLREELGGTAVNVKRINRIIKVRGMLPQPTGGP
jgi:hypothetical protein